MFCIRLAIFLVFINRQWSWSACAYANTAETSGIVEEFAPIRIFTDFENASEKDAALDKRLYRVIREAVERIAKVIYVSRTDGSLLLNRTACHKRWTSGPNIHKCSSIRRNYRGEFCQENVDNFKIPNEHLNGLDIFENISTVKRKEIITRGIGVPNTDFIFYVRRNSTKYCQPQEMFAYATVCQLGVNDRPVAGYANFCPVHLSDERFNFAKSVTIAMHELIHVLGFSVTLFSKYKDCQTLDGKLNCYTRKSPVLRHKDHSTLLLPRALDLVRAAQNCSQECLNLEDVQTENVVGKSSHWQNQPLSIMSKDIATSNATYLDDLTLTVLEDSGWYTVNYSAARQFGDLTKIEEPKIGDVPSRTSVGDQRLFLTISALVSLYYSVIT